MPTKMMLTGDVNLMNVNDPTVPFKNVAEEGRAADIFFSNLECCLYQPKGDAVDGEHKSEGFFASPGTAGEALKFAGIKGVGIANNVNYGEAAINGSIARLDELGIRHTGAGANRDLARAPAIIEANGVRVGFLQRTSVFWPTNHEAAKSSTGVAITMAHTAYQLPLHKLNPKMSPCNRPGLPPIIMTFTDPRYMQMLKDEVADLKKKTDFVVLSCHWGLHQDLLDYMPEIAHAGVDAGADVVMGHGPHFSLPVEAYKGKPIFYGLGSFSFHTGHGGIAHGNWVGMLARVTLEGKSVKSATFQFVRHNEKNETVLCKLDDERATLEDISKRGGTLTPKLTPQGDQVAIDLRA